MIPHAIGGDERYLIELQASIDVRRRGDYSGARRIAMRLVKSRPHESSVWHTLGQLWTDIGEFGAALECSQEAVRLLKSRWDAVDNQERAHYDLSGRFQTASLGLAQALLRVARFKEAWPYWEAGRLGVSWSPWPGSRYWCGSDPAPESLLVQSEGGYGDLFMFLRWLPLLKSVKGVERLGLMLWPSLYGFCNWKALGVDEIYKIDQDTVRFDEWQSSVSIMSMSAAFKLESWKDIPKAAFPAFYFPPETSPVERDDHFRLGFCWRAEENTSPVRIKSLPVEIAEEIGNRIRRGYKVGLKLLSLSPERADLYTESEFEQPLGLIVEQERMTSWRKTAEYILTMDFVLTVDTAVAHLAGLLGVPALVLLPKASCWRWGIGTDTSAWYGKQLILYRQPEVLKWDAEEIAAAVLQRIEA